MIYFVKINLMDKDYSLQSDMSDKIMYHNIHTAVISVVIDKDKKQEAQRSFLMM